MRQVLIAVVMAAIACGISTAAWAPPGLLSNTGFTADGAIVNGGTTGYITNQSGTFTLGAGPDGNGNWVIQLNGVVQAGSPAAAQLYMIAGLVYQLTGPGIWWQWNVSGGAWTGPVSDPRPPGLGLFAASAPPAPSIPSTTGLGATVATLSGTYNPVQSFTGSFMFVTPNFDQDTYSISGANLIVAANGPGVGSRGGTTQHVTVEAVQIPATADAVTSTAPNGPPLRSANGTWSWGPSMSGRQIGGGNFGVDTVIYLNGKQQGSAILMEVHHGGQLYVNTSSAGWFVWNPTTTIFVSSAAP